MRLIKIKENHYVIVDDSEIKEGDFVYDSKDKVIRFVKQYLPDEWIKKITHSTQPLNDKLHYAEYKIITLSQVKELLGEVDVEKKAKKYTEERNYLFEEEQGYVAGYNECLEDNKDKKYTLEDIKKAYYQGHKSGLGSENSLTFERTIQSLQPKTEWEVEFDTNGKLKLK